MIVNPSRAANLAGLIERVPLNCPFGTPCGAIPIGNTVDVFDDNDEVQRYLS